MLNSKKNTVIFFLFLASLVFGQEKITITIVGLVHSGNKNYSSENLYKYVANISPDKIFQEQGNEEKLPFFLKAQLFLGLAKYTDERKFVDSLSKTLKVPIVNYDYNFRNRYKYLKNLTKSEQNMIRKINDLSLNKSLSVKEQILLDDYNKTSNIYYKNTFQNTIQKNNTLETTNMSKEYFSKYFNNLGAIVNSNPNLQEYRSFMKEYEFFFNKRNLVMANNILNNIGDSKNIVVLCGLLHKSYLIDLLQSRLDKKLYIIK